MDTLAIYSVEMLYLSIVEREKNVWLRRTNVDCRLVNWEDQC